MTGKEIYSNDENACKLLRECYKKHNEDLFLTAQEYGVSVNTLRKWIHHIKKRDLPRRHTVLPNSPRKHGIGLRRK